MKHFITTFALLFLLSKLSFSQVQYGFKGGINSVNAYVVNKDGTKPATQPGTGLFAGGMLKIPFDKNLYFVPGIQYSYKHYTINYMDAKVNTCELQLHYIEMPFLLNYDFKSSGNYPFIQFGPSFSIALSGNQVFDKPGEESSTEKMQFAYNAYGRYEANAVLNLGYHFRNNLSVFGGYSMGLGTIVNDDNGPVIKHRMLSLGLGYYINR